MKAYYTFGVIALLLSVFWIFITSYTLFIPVAGNGFGSIGKMILYIASSEGIFIFLALLFWKQVSTHPYIKYTFTSIFLICIASLVGIIWLVSIIKDIFNLQF